MDHHTSWFSFFPWYQGLENTLNERYHHLVVYPAGARYETVHHVYGAILVLLLLMGLSLYSRAKIANVDKAVVPPKQFGVVAFFEMFLETIMGMMKNVIGPDYKRYVPLIGSLGLFIFFSNIIGLIPGFLPATDNLNTSLACGMVVFLYFNYHGFRAHGAGHVLHLANPVGTWWGWFLMPLMLPIEVISLCVRPLSLGLRLAGNMTGDHQVLSVFAGISPILLPLPFYMLGLLICVIQTAVFCILSCVYIGLHTAPAEHDH
jgi:F-type H+-transporting ATPase subunit a